MSTCSAINRREACRLLGTGLAGLGLGLANQPVRAQSAADRQSWKPEYILASCMFGTLPLEKILPEVRKTGAKTIDIWPRPHGNQREQIETLGVEKFQQMLQEYQVRLGILTHYDLGPFKLRQDLPLAKRFGARLMISGSGGPRGLKGPELKSAVIRFVEKLKPHLKVAEEAGVTIGIENHGNSLIESPDSIRYLAEAAGDKRLGIALAPYHLPQDPELLAGLINDLGPKLVHFYAWQHGKGAMKKRPKEEEMQQMPGYGPLDFGPIMKALAAIRYPGWISIFMHPVPRGVPILPSAPEVTAAINRSRTYLETVYSRNEANK